MQTWPAYDGSAVDNPQPPSDGAHVHDHEQLMDAEPVLANGIAAINAVLDCASTSAGEAFPGEIAFPHQPASRTHPGHGAPLEEIASLPIVSSPPRITLTIPPACLLLRRIPALSSFPCLMERRLLLFRPIRHITYDFLL